LNGHVKALQVLLDRGCSPDPPKPKENKISSAAVESPLEINARVHGGNNSELGRQMEALLRQAMSRNRSETTN